MLRLDAVQGDEVWWRLRCENLDHHGQPVNNTGTGWAHCGQTLQDGPRYTLLEHPLQNDVLSCTIFDHQQRPNPNLRHCQEASHLHIMLVPAGLLA